MKKYINVFMMLLFGAASLFAQKPHVLMISIDGMKPEYITHSSEHNLQLPALERFLTSATYAEGVVGVVPTLTYPSHTTLVTGVWPSQHGIYANTKFDPLKEHEGQSYAYWFFGELKAQTLYQAAKQAGLTTAAIGWPVTVGAPVDYLYAEYFPSPKDNVSPNDIVHPSDLRDKVGPLVFTDMDGIDEKRTALSVDVINNYNPNFILVHLVMLDHEEHGHAPFSPEANAAMEKLDKEAGQVIDAELKKNPTAKIVLVSDHGFARVDHRVRLNVLFTNAGLITLRSDTPAKSAPSIESWQAEAWENGGAAYIMMRDPSDAAVTAKVKQVLDTAAADPKYGIKEVLTRDEVIRRGGDPAAVFLVSFKPGWTSDGSGFTGASIQDAPSTGTHGYLSDNPEMRSTFMVMGDGVARGRNLGIIDMRQIAPSVASMLGVKLIDAKQHPVNYRP